MGDDRKEGLIAAIEQLMPRTGQTEGRAEALAALRGEQLALLPTAAALADVGASDDIAERAGPGRPPGSKNKRTEDWVRFIGARYRDPRLFLVETYNRPVYQLAAELRCDVVEAFNFQIKCAEAVLPYLASKMPVAVQISQTGEITLNLVAPRPAPAVLKPLLVIEDKSEEDQ